MAWIEHTYSDAGALAKALAETMLQAVDTGLDERGRALLALAGGRTPWPVYERVATRAASISLFRHSRECGTPWTSTGRNADNVNAPAHRTDDIPEAIHFHEKGSRMDSHSADQSPAVAGTTTEGRHGPAALLVFPTDDRCVPRDHSASNARELAQVFGAFPMARIEPLTTPDGEPDASERHAQSVLAPHRDVPFDFVLLGMGTDAHTASLFPGATRLAAALDPASALDAVRVDPDPLPPEAPFPRISLTAARLLRSRALHLVVTGEAKRAVLEQAYASRDPMRHPIAAILHASCAHVHVHWSP